MNVSIEEYAAQAREALSIAVSAAKQSFQSPSAPERIILVDGSYIAPAWRAMTGGAEAWHHSDELLEKGERDAAADVTQAFSEACDELDREFGTYWEDGILWLDNPYLFTGTIKLRFMADDHAHAAQRINAWAATLHEHDGVQKSATTFREYDGNVDDDGAEWTA